MPVRDVSRYGEKKEDKSTFDKIIDLFDLKSKAGKSQAPPQAQSSPVPQVDLYEAEKFKKSLKRNY